MTPFCIRIYRTGRRLSSFKVSYTLFEIITSVASMMIMTMMRIIYYNINNVLLLLLLLLLLLTVLLTFASTL
jgi:hypothetical protein